MELEINGTVAELGDSVPAITRKSIDVNSPTDRYIDFTNKFQLPDTATNRRIFNSPNGVGTNNQSHDQLYDVVLRDISELFAGKGYLESSTKDKFTFQIVDKAKDLFQQLDIKLNEILWDDCDTLLTTASIDALDSIDINNCWFWGKACYHVQGLQVNTDQTTGDARCKYSRPAFYVQALLNRAVTQAGYTMISPLPDLAFTSNHKQFFFTSYQKTFSATYNVTGSLALTGFDTYDFKMATVTVTSTTVGGTRRFYIRIRGHVTTTATMYLFVHTVDVTGNKVIDSLIPLPADGYIDFTSSEIYDGPTGMTVSMELQGTGTAVFDDVIAYSNLDEKNIDLSANPYLGAKIKAQDHLPDLTYLDLIKLISVVSNKLPYVDTKTKTLSFIDYSKINKLNSVDWSEKFIDDTWQVQSNFSGVYQKNWLKYSNDKTVAPSLGEWYFENSNKSLEKEGDYITLKFGASYDVVINSNHVAQVAIYSDTTRIVDQEIAIRLFYASGSTLTFCPLCWRLLAENYYAGWFNSLSRIRMIDAEFNLSKTDVIGWHPMQMVYVDYFKTAFIVLEISNFINDRKTKVKLLAYGR